MLVTSRKPVTNEVYPMIELLRSNDPVLISFATSLLSDAKIQHSVADSHMSVIDGSINAVTNRIMVAEEQYEAAKELLADAGVTGAQ
jgi:Putative prokaryotic signal transducing protein